MCPSIGEVVKDDEHVTATFATTTIAIADAGSRI
jgi:hypothetical protein